MCERTDLCIFIFQDTGRLSMVHDWITCCGMIQWIFMTSLIIVHTSILFFLKVPGCPLGYLGPGGLHMNSSAPNCTGGASRYIDEIIFTPRHMYNKPGIDLVKLYKINVVFDPEG